MTFNPMGGYDQDPSGYCISRGSIPSATQRGYITVWSAFTALPPAGHRIMNGDSMYFFSRVDAQMACVEHQAGRTAA